MYQVIIADDEPWSIYGLKTLIDWESLGFTIVATAPDGLATLDAVRQHRPDLLISDIRMPGLDGLQLIRALKEENLDTAVVLVTGYSDFAYAQEALRQGVFDYLVKQVRRGELTAALHRVRQHLDEKSASPDWSTYFTLFSGEPLLTVAQCLPLLKLPPASSCCILTRLYEQKIDGPMISAPVRENGLSRISFRIGTRKEAVLLCFDAPPPIPLPAPGVIQGSSGVASAQDAFFHLYRRAETALSTALFRGQSAAVCQADPPDALSSELTAFALALRSGDQAALLSRLQEIRQGCLRLQFDTVLSIVNRLIVQLQDSRFGGWEALEPRHELLSCPPSLDELFDPILRCITAEQSSQPLAPSQIQQILSALDDMFTQDIRIADLARRFFLSANYLSILLKRETGCTFTDLVILKRITLARKLLAETNLPIQEIVEQVGYKEYSTFIKLFKKHTGVTPHAYRVEMRKSGAPTP